MGLVIILMLVAVFLCVRGTNADHRAKRMGYYGIASSLAAFATVVFAANKLSVEQVTAFVACSVVAAALALIGVVLSIRTLVIRRGKGDVVIGIPITGLLFGLAGIGGGIGVYVIGGRVIIPSDENTWTWHSDEHAFDVTIPSERWKQKPSPNVLGEFRGSRPTIGGLVAEVRPGATEEEFEKAIAFGSKMQSNTPTTNTFQEKGKNAFGNEYWICMGDAKSAKNEDYFFGFSITRVRDKSIIMLVEGSYNMLSEIGRNQEANAMRAQAKVFLGSAR